MDKVSIVAFANMLLETARILASKGEGSILSTSADLANRAALMVETIMKNNNMQGWQVHLISFGDCKISCIKTVRKYTDLGLKEAKELVEKVPVLVLKTTDELLAKNMYNEFINLRPYDVTYSLPKVELCSINLKEIDEK